MEEGGMSPQLEEPIARRTTKSRILEAAMLRFAQYSYEETRLRDIAADVGIDVALVHRSFGSKERLFEEVVSVAFQARQVLSGEVADLPERLTERLLEPSLDRALRVVDPLDIIVRNLLSREAIPILRNALFRDVVDPLDAKLAAPSAQRAALLAACLAGIGILRHVVRAEPLQEEHDDAIRPLLRGLIEGILNGPA
ncbi:TetR/AcrR family transcriptional regulator [Rhodovarius crocodyli]|uniref:TetR/AcrR family transcriptional regulator n=2 Tax=Rhodovarius crocodyli TaxID=1979269 RepID=A0A437M220_9PROT|nr:TetR/AcrR family transcriptional regulator [Rhodovarius crocodyli]